jgi:long-chain acyl-CoA synthetase
METKYWQKHYDEGVPHTVHPYPEGTLLDVLSEAARERPDHPALLFKDAHMSYGELERLSNVLAAALVAEGVEKGDRVALMLPNCPQFVIGQLAVWKAGVVVVPVNPLLPEQEMLRTLADCGANTVLVLTPFYEKVKAVQSRTDVRRVIATNIKEYMPVHARILFSALKEKKEDHRVALRGEDLSLDDLLQQYADSSRPVVPVGPQDPALVIYTGHKTVVAAHGALLVAAMRLHAWFGPAIADWDDVVMGNMPLFDVYGAVTMACALVGRNPVALIPDPKDWDDIVAAIQKARPALLSGAPAFFAALLNHPKVRAGQVDCMSIKLCFSAATPLLVEIKNHSGSPTGGQIVKNHSLTESMVAAVTMPVQGTTKPGSAVAPVPDDGHSILLAGQVGQIVIRAPQMVRGYWQPLQNRERDPQKSVTSLSGSLAVPA